MLVAPTRERPNAADTPEWNAVLGAQYEMHAGSAGTLPGQFGHANDYERDLINAMAILYDKSAIPDNNARDQAYLKAARDLHVKYPEDADVGALYAAAYMSIGRWDYWDANGKPKSETADVAKALEQVLHAEPGHPGANHLYIHLLEASLEPERALAAADRLEATMPIAGHVVHMPAHIYVRVGQYSKAIENNRRSQRVDQQLAEIWGDMPLPNLGTYPLSHKMHAPHAIDFIRYAATVQGNYEVAIDAAEKSAAFINEQNLDLRGGQKRIAAPWLVNEIFGEWVEDENNYTEPPDWGQPMRHYLGAALLEAGRAKDAEAVYRRDLRWNQNNGWSLFGLMQSLDQQGRHDQASAVRKEFEAAWKNATVALSQSRI